MLHVGLEHMSDNVIVSINLITIASAVHRTMILTVLDRASTQVVVENDSLHDKLYIFLLDSCSLNKVTL